MTYVSIMPESPNRETTAALMEELQRFRAAITGDTRRTSPDWWDSQGPRSLFVVARNLTHEPVGCGGLRPLEESLAEVRYMYARPNTKGVGSAILHHLEVAALQLDYRVLWLGTQVLNDRAVRFYELHGFRRIQNYGKYVGDTKAICLEKILCF